MSDHTPGAAPTHLRCEYLVDPLGVDEPRPRLSWVVPASRPGRRQTAYRVRVATSQEHLDDGRADMWDSGVVRSTATMVSYDGAALPARLRCWWQVEVWDEHGEAAVSAQATWEMGLLSRDDWIAQWVMRPEQQRGLYGGPSPFMRTSFSVAGPVRSARAYVTALGLYELHCNGRVVGDGRLTPGWTDYAQRLHYQAHDVTEMVHPGENVLGAVLGEGWYCGYIGPDMVRDHYGSTPQLLVQVEVELTDGSRIVVASDGRWRSSLGPVISSDLLMGEVHDARLELDGWSAPGYDDRAWEPVTVARGTDAALTASAMPPVRRIEELRPVKILDDGAGAVLVDFGQNMVGWARLIVRGAEAGREITLRFGEMLDAEGRLYTENLRRARSTDHYICQGGETEEVFEPRFTFHGFRYVEVAGYPGRPSVDDIRGVVAHTDLVVTGDFRCSDEMVNQLHRNIVWGQRGNFLEVPTDCPQRDERLGWTGDAQIFAGTAAFNMDVAPFFTKWLLDLDDARTDDGAFPDVAPRVVVTGEGSPAWGDAGVLLPWTMYQRYGDTRILDRCYAAMAHWVDRLAEANPDLLWRNKTGLNHGDWLSIDADTPKDLLATAYFAHSTSITAQAAHVLGHLDDHRRYLELAEEIRRAFVDAFVDEEARLLGDTQTGYVLALRFGLLPTDARPLAAAHLVEDIERRGGHLSTGFLGVGHLLPALTEAGHLDVAYRLLCNDTFPSWGYSIRHGATTIWERWDGWTEEHGFQDPAMNSFNHYALGSVGEWLYETVGGISPASPGYERVVIRPRPGGGITWAACHFDSVRGRIGCDWRLDEDRFVMSVAVPVGTTASVHLPMVGAGHVRLDGEDVSAEPGREGDELCLELSSGTYELEVV